MARKAKALLAPIIAWCWTCRNFENGQPRAMPLSQADLGFHAGHEIHKMWIPQVQRKRGDR